MRVDSSRLDRADAGAATAQRLLPVPGESGAIVRAGRWTGKILFVACVAVLGWLVLAMRRPRVARVKGCLRLDLRPGRPLEVPLEYVECFFLGQGPSMIGKGVVGQAEAANVVVRLAERAKSWRERDVWPMLGSWCDGYITIHGAWCEPIHAELIERLNRQLVEAKRVVSHDAAAE